MAFTNAYDVSDDIYSVNSYVSNVVKTFSLYTHEVTEADVLLCLGYVNSSNIAFSNVQEYIEDVGYPFIDLVTNNPIVIYSTAKGITYGVSAVSPGDTAAQLIEQNFTPPIASFSADIVAGYPPLVVNFFDNSSDNPTYWEWDFGDGSPHSFLQNPQHTYNDIGLKHVILLVSNDYSYDTESKPAYISVDPLSPIIDLNSAQVLTLSGNVPTVRIVLNVCAEYLFRIIRTSADIFDIRSNINTLKSGVNYAPTACEKPKDPNQGIY